MGEWLGFGRGYVLVVCGVLVAALASGCGLEESYTGMGDGALPGDPNFSSGGELVCNVTCECIGGGGGGNGGETPCVPSELPSLEGRAYRITALSIGAPLPEVFIDPVNDFLAEEIEAGNIDIIIRVDVDDRDEQTLEGVIFSAVAGGPPYRVGGEEAPIVMQICGATLRTLEGAEFAIPMAEGVLDPPSLPLSDIALFGSMVLDGDGIAAGTLEAVLTAESAAATRAMGQPLGVFLDRMGSAPTLDLDLDGTPDSWEAFGAFAATRVELAD